MGSDDCFHKGKARRLQELKRQAAKRSPYDRILIVCEGEKTEPFYFEGLIGFLRLNTVNITIHKKNTGLDPSKLINIGKQEFKKGGYDKMYCVFDKDVHDKFKQAVSELRDSKKFTAITSAPCFEFWILLHYQYTSRCFSSCPEVVKEIKKYMPGYAKNSRGNFKLLKDKIPDAIKHAKRIEIDNKKTNSDNPSTNVHILIEHLQRLHR